MKEKMENYPHPHECIGGKTCKETLNDPSDPIMEALDDLLYDVVRGKYGTKHRVELILRLENIIAMM